MEALASWAIDGGGVPGVRSMAEPHCTHFVSEWFEFVVEGAKTSHDSNVKQGTLASPTTKVSAIELERWNQADTTPAFPDEKTRESNATT